MFLKGIFTLKQDMVVLEEEAVHVLHRTTVLDGVLAMVVTVLLSFIGNKIF